MRQTRLYHPGEIQCPGQVTLTPDASHHLVTVLRTTQNAPLILFNGDGFDYVGTLTEPHKKNAQIRITERIEVKRESPVNIHLGQGLCRGEKMDWVIQKAVELGVTEITPLITEYSNVKLYAERSDKKHQHWKQVMISACEQSGRAVLPILNPTTSLSTWLSNTQGTLKWALTPNEAQTLQNTSKPDSMVLLVGPEGGLSDTEIQVANTAGFISTQLGPRVLRTETAPIVALSVIQTLWGDFQNAK